MLLELVFLLPLLLYLWLWWARGYWRRRNVFQVDGEFFLGSTGRALFTDVNFFKTFFDNIYRAHKDKKLIGFYSFLKPMLVVTDLDLIRQILITDFNSYPLAGFQLDTKDKLIRFNPFLHSGELWKSLRGVHAQSLSPLKLKEYLPLMRKSAQAMDAFIEENISEPIKVMGLVKLYAIDNITSAIFGLEPSAFTNRENGFRKHATDTIFDENMNKSWHFAKYAPFLNVLFRLRFLSKETEDFFIDVAEKTFSFRKKSNVVRNDLVEQLMKLDKKRLAEGMRGMDAVEVAGHMSTTYIDAVDTSSIFLSYLLLEVANRQEVQDKLRREILAAGASPQDYDLDKIQSLEYLNMVLNETFRTHSVMSYLTRECARDSNLGGVDIQKGTKVIIPYTAIINDPEYFPEPHKFLPERFSPANSPAIRGKFFPFGEGPKQCVGMNYALLQVKLACIALLQKYRLLPANEVVGGQVPDSSKPFFFTKPDEDERIVFVKL